MLGPMTRASTALRGERVADEAATGGATGRHRDGPAPQQGGR